MNREIKFRVRLYDGSILGYEFTDSHGDWHRIDDDGATWFAVFAIVGKMVREQYTGLKDKNGVEIYEGDIFSWGVNVAEVVFDHGYFVFAGMGLHPCNLQGEIIGNIYSNPELLK